MPTPNEIDAPVDKRHLVPAYPSRAYHCRLWFREGVTQQAATLEIDAALQDLRKVMLADWETTRGRE